MYAQMKQVIHSEWLREENQEKKQSLKAKIDLLEEAEQQRNKLKLQRAAIEEDIRNINYINEDQRQILLVELQKNKKAISNLNEELLFNLELLTDYEEIL